MARECYSTPDDDHYCDAWEGDDSMMPSNEVPSDDRSYFYIKIVAEFSTHSMAEDGLPMESLENVENVESFLVPYDELIHDEEASWSAISGMLSSVQIPIDDQPNMLHRISHCARSMARAAHNVGRKVLPMMVSIFVDDFVDSDEEVEDDEEDIGAVLRESMEAEMAVSRQVPASKESVEALETVEGGLGSAKQCVICQEEIVGGSEAKRMPCRHVYHGDCIVRWLGVSNFCPLCRFQLPT